MVLRFRQRAQCAMTISTVSLPRWSAGKWTLTAAWAGLPVQTGTYRTNTRRNWTILPAGAGTRVSPTAATILNTTVDTRRTYFCLVVSHHRCLAIILVVTFVSWLPWSPWWKFSLSNFRVVTIKYDLDTFQLMTVTMSSNCWTRMEKRPGGPDCWLPVEHSRQR